MKDTWGVWFGDSCLQFGCVLDFASPSEQLNGVANEPQHKAKPESVDSHQEDAQGKMPRLSQLNHVGWKASWRSWARKGASNHTVDSAPPVNATVGCLIPETCNGILCP